MKVILVKLVEEHVVGRVIDDPGRVAVAEMNADGLFKNLMSHD